MAKHLNSGSAGVNETPGETRVDFPTLGLTVDLSRMNMPASFFSGMAGCMNRAFDAMSALEQGAIANPDENRMVGHYWLRNAALAPTDAIRSEIETTVLHVKEFAAGVHAGLIGGEAGSFRNFLLIGIGGSALGPQFVAHALGQPNRDRMKAFFFDNTDPDGMARVIETIGDDLGRTLCVVVSKSGGTKETSNGMQIARSAYEARGLQFARHAVAITREKSSLDQTAVIGKWLARFPMWDWVGGRTSEMSAVGLLPAALQGFCIDALLAGAKACDEASRSRVLTRNPSAMIALAWFLSGDGKGLKNMVVVPYKDRLELLSRYLQQLIMESIGKEMDAHGNQVNQGISVFGNKGTTDQHSYIQQLRDGIDNYFLTLVEVLRDQTGAPILVDPTITSGDYLHGFLAGTREAIAEKKRGVMTLRIEKVSGFAIGVLIALFERAVGLYASLVNVNAYHQPGVEAGKRGATEVIALQEKVVACFRNKRGFPMSVASIATDTGSDNRAAILDMCLCLASNPSSGVQVVGISTPENLFRAF